MHRRPALLACLVLLAGRSLWGSGQATGASAPQLPTFRVGVEYVEVDTAVTDRDGHFVRDLTQDDFQIFEDGKPQPISTFSLVDIPVDRADRPLYTESPLEPDVRSNTPAFDGRVYVMVVDDLHTPFERTRRLRTAARQFVERHLGANDLMAVVHTAGPADANQDLTGSKRLLLAAIDRTEGRQRYSVDDIRSGDVFRGQGTRPAGRGPLNPAEAERELSALRSLSVLRDTAQRFVGLRGRRKAILFVSEGIDYEVASWDGHQSGSFVDDSMRSVVAAAGRANVSVYGIDPRGLVGLLVDDTPFRPMELSQESLHWLSSETGGFAVVSANKFAEPFDRIVRDNSSYYVLAYYPPASKPGTSHGIEVRVRRPNVTVRTRQGYVTSKPTSPAAAAGAAGIPSGARGFATPELTDALRTPLPRSDLAMRVFAAPFKGAASQASVLVGIEVRGRDGAAAAGDTLTVAYTVVDGSGKVRGGTTEAVPIGAEAGAVGVRAGDDVRLLGRIDLPPGRYQIHAAGQDARAGNVGSVIYDLDVPDFARAPFSMSGLVVTAPTAAAVTTLHPDDSLKTVLPASPVGSRTFLQDDDLSLFAEVYDNEGAQPHKVDIGATVTSDDGRVVAKMDEVRESSDLQGRRGGYGYTATIALRSLPPGRYVLTVSARSRLGNPDGVVRQAPFVVIAPGELPAP